MRYLILLLTASFLCSCDNQEVTNGSGSADLTKFELADARNDDLLLSCSIMRDGNRFFFECSDFESSAGEGIESMQLQVNDNSRPLLFVVTYQGGCSDSTFIEYNSSGQITKRTQFEQSLSSENCSRRFTIEKKYIYNDQEQLISIEGLEVDNFNDDAQELFIDSVEVDNGNVVAIYDLISGDAKETFEYYNDLSVPEELRWFFDLENPNSNNLVKRETNYRLSPADVIDSNYVFDENGLLTRINVSSTDIGGPWIYYTFDYK